MALRNYVVTLQEKEFQAKAQRRKENKGDGFIVSIILFLERYRLIYSPEKQPKSRPCLTNASTSGVIKSDAALPPDVRRRLCLAGNHALSIVWGYAPFSEPTLRQTGQHPGPTAAEPQSLLGATFPARHSRRLTSERRSRIPARFTFDYTPSTSDNVRFISPVAPVKA